MNDMTQIDTTNAVAAPADAVIVTVSSLFAGASKALNKQFVAALDGADTLDAQYAAIAEARLAVDIAMDTNGDFDAAGRAYRAANNKLDKLLTGRDAQIDSAMQGIAAVRKLLTMMELDLSELEV